MDEPVLLTGASGRVGQAILGGIGDDYTWRLFDREPPTDDPDHEFVVADITDETAVREAASDVGAIVHLAGDPRPEAPWESVLRNNIDGTRTVLDAALAAGVDRVVFASSNHAVGHYETDRKPDLYRSDDDFRLDGTERPRPGNLYGVSKAAGETLGRYYHDEHGLTFAAVRIGNLTAGHPPIDYERGQAMWLSPGTARTSLIAVSARTTTTRWSTASRTTTANTTRWRVPKTRSATSPVTTPPSGTATRRRLTAGNSAL